MLTDTAAILSMVGVVFLQTMGVCARMLGGQQASALILTVEGSPGVVSHNPIFYEQWSNISHGMSNEQNIVTHT